VADFIFFLNLYRTCLANPANPAPRRHRPDDLLVKQGEVIERLYESFLTQNYLTINALQLTIPLTSGQMLKLRLWNPPLFETTSKITNA
jgi:hypothetical protein